MTDNDYMQRALRLAERGIFSTAPNPRVGCVLVKDGKIVGEAYHQYSGHAHAEALALQQAGEQAHGATAYVTLEPCAHHGQTPPCAQALIDSEIKRVVIACVDPNPLVAGKGIALLEQAGIAVTTGVEQVQALSLNEGFFQRINQQRPFVRLKLATSLDGKTALANGQSQWITCAEARQDGHYWRLYSDAVIAGSGSIINDNARLNARYDSDLPQKQPLRVIIDSQGKTPTDVAIFSIASPILIASTCAPSKHYPDFVEQIQLPANGKHLCLPSLLTALGERGVNNVLVEAGQALASAFIGQDLVDELLLYLAPTLIGDDGRGLSNLASPTHLSATLRYDIYHSMALGSDWRFRLRPKPTITQ